nr:DNA translocase FtsK [Neobacillus soli]
MSWFHNLFQKFKKDDEEFDDYLIHKHEGLPFQGKYEGIKDLDTKVSYQYPKGIDRLFQTREMPKKTAEETLRKKRTERPPEKRRETEPTEVPTIKQELPKIKKEPSPRRNGPFQPTETPSPVFGFNRPQQNTNLSTVVEHELSHFLNEAVEIETDAFAAQEETITEIVLTAPTVKNDEVLNNETTSVEIDSPEVEEVIVENATTETVASVQTIDDYIPLEKIDPAQKEEVEVQAQAEPPAPKQSHLPFNVMMLKQDKQKWEERKRRREIVPQQVLETENNPPEKVNQIIELFPVKEVEAEVEVEVEVEKNTDDGYYILPTSSLLNPPITETVDTEWLQQQEELLNQTLQNFNVGAGVVNVAQGPAVTRFEVQPEPGVKVNKITNLSDDIKLSLAARDIRIEAPIPGKHTIGIEVPNQKSRPVFINEIIESSVFKDSTSPLTAVLGLDIAGNPIVTDLKKMPHGLIAGATGSGKSVCINTILVSLLYKASPEDLKLLLIDPKMVELAPYNRIPHLVSPVITDVKAATAALKWAVDEMERRYELFAHTGVRDINRFNELAMKHKQYSDKLPFIVIVIDELADLMMMSPADVEEAICRIAQKARACGIHLIVATQRPSVDVITGLIKANIPTRIAFSVSSQVDSRTIIDISGAEKLLGRGDMLFLENGSSKPVRLQGTFVSDEEIDVVVAHVREQREPEYLFEQEELLKKAQVTEDEDELFYEACEFIIDHGGASTSSLQRRFKIGYNRAARLMDMLETNGYITSANGSKAREVLITEADLESLQDANANN